jgi:hypothetical protein
MSSCCVLVALGLAIGAGCPSPPVPPPPPPPPGDAGAPESEDAAGAVEAEVREAVAPEVEPEPPPLADPRFAAFGAGRGPSEGEIPAIAPTAVPDGERDPPIDIGDRARAALAEQFGCAYVRQLPWPASWLSPTGVVLSCCQATGGTEVVDRFAGGCRELHACSLLIDEGIGALSKVDTITALRRRVAPVRDPRTALAVLDATVRWMVPFFGDTPDDQQYVRGGGWRYLVPEITGTRVVENRTGGYEVVTFVQNECGCLHPLEEVRFRVDELAGVVEESRRTVMESLSAACVD